MNELPLMLDADSLREQLMAPEPMQRARGLHALELEVEKLLPSQPSALVVAAQRFAARGIPYYQRQDRHFEQWVARAVSYWERLHGASGTAPAENALAG